MEQLKISSRSPFENIVGFSRGVKAGNFIAISGTAPIGKDGKTAGVGDPAQQAKRCFEIIKNTIEKAGADISDVIRTRILLKRISDWEKVGQIHAEYFKNIKPATTIYEVSNFINPEWLIEIEVDAFVSDE